jgi:hypothetical protein
MPLKLPFGLGFDAGPEGLTDALTDAEGKILATADDWDLEDLSEIAGRINDRDLLAAELAEANREFALAYRGRGQMETDLAAKEAEVERLMGQLGRCRELLLDFLIEGRVTHEEASDLFDSLPPAAALTPPPGEGGGA